MQEKLQFHDWHQSRMEGLLIDIEDQLLNTDEAVIAFANPRPERFQRAVLDQLKWNGYSGRFESDHSSNLPRLIVRRADAALHAGA
jgi:hypothetical protein